MKREEGVAQKGTGREIGRGNPPGDELDRLSPLAYIQMASLSFQEFI
jgi:hypothetical protein